MTCGDLAASFLWMCFTAHALTTPWSIISRSASEPITTPSFSIISCAFRSQTTMWRGRDRPLAFWNWSPQNPGKMFLVPEINAENARPCFQTWFEYKTNKFHSWHSVAVFQQKASASVAEKWYPTNLVIEAESRSAWQLVRVLGAKCHSYCYPLAIG